MSTLRDIATFSSEQFAPFLPEQSQVNPARYGAELAYWLSAELAKQGVVTSYPNAEDWGWFIEFLPDSGSEFAVHCSNVNGSNHQWLLSLRRYARKMFGRDKPPFEEAAQVVQAIRTALEKAPQVRDFKWLYDKEVAA